MLLLAGRRRRRRRAGSDSGDEDWWMMRRYRWPRRKTTECSQSSFAEKQEFANAMCTECLVRP